MADVPHGEHSARHISAPVLRGRYLTVCLWPTPGLRLPFTGAGAGCEWRWQQPGAARGRQFLGPACHAAIPHMQQKQQYTGSLPLSLSVEPGEPAL
jgi:hypothetical protein